MINISQISKLDNFVSSSHKLPNEIFEIHFDNSSLNQKALFIAIVGSRYNPLKNLDIVISSMCKFVVVEDSEDSKLIDSRYLEALCFIKVKNIFRFIEELGALVSSDFKNRGGQIIAISGSNGKTTTKEMIKHIFDITKPSSSICTQKNNNNNLGVPFTMFQIRENTKFAIVELGSNHPGEIKFLCEMLKPDYGLTTNIGDTHLEFFDTRENVFNEEAYLFHSFEKAFFLNIDDEYLKKLNKNTNVISYGENLDADYIINYEKKNILVNNIEIKNSNITGKHNAVNLVAAYIVSKKILGKSSKELVRACESFIPAQNRSQWIESDSHKIFLDAYNANPSSMIASAEGFLSCVDDHTKVAFIVGDMNELGSNSSNLHRDVGKWLLEANVGVLIFVGQYVDDYIEDGVENVYKFSSVDALSPHFIKLVKSCNYLFIKGSRSLQLERILDIK